MIRKSSLIGLFVCALLICGCSKEEPESSSSASTPSIAPSVDQTNDESKPEPEIEIVAVTGKKVVKIETSMGDILVELNEEKAPITVKNFLSYVEEGFYDGTIFHRVINRFMIQGGGFNDDMSRKSTKPPIKIESSNGLRNDRGTIAMARTGVPDSATSQFFINHKNNDGLNYDGASNPGYAVFGKVIQGLDVVDKIAVVPTTRRNGMDDVPVDVITINSIAVISK